MIAVNNIYKLRNNNTTHNKRTHLNKLCLYDQFDARFLKSFKRILPFDLILFNEVLQMRHCIFYNY